MKEIRQGNIGNELERKEENVGSRVKEKKAKWSEVKQLFFHWPLTVFSFNFQFPSIEFWNQKWTNNIKIIKFSPCSFAINQESLSHMKSSCWIQAIAAIFGFDEG